MFVVDDNPVVAITSGANHVSEDRLGGALGADDVRMADPDEVRRTTGWSVGGVPPICHDSNLDVLIDETVLEHAEEIGSKSWDPDHPLNSGYGSFYSNGHEVGVRRVYVDTVPEGSRFVAVRDVDEADHMAYLVLIADPENVEDPEGRSAFDVGSSAAQMEEMGAWVDWSEKGGRYIPG